MRVVYNIMDDFFKIGVCGIVIIIGCIAVTKGEKK